MVLILKKTILMKPKEKFLEKELQGIMITNNELIDINNIPLSRIFSNNIEIKVPVKVDYKIYKPCDKIIGDFL